MVRENLAAKSAMLLVQSKRMTLKPPAHGATVRMEKVSQAKYAYSVQFGYFYRIIQ